MEEYKLWGIGWRVAKCELAAAYADAPIVKAPYTPGLSSRTPHMLGLRPDGKVRSGSNTQKRLWTEQLMQLLHNLAMCITSIARTVLVTGAGVRNPARGFD